MNKRGLLVVVSGPSGVGKGTVLRSLLAQEQQVRFSVSATTRTPREGEVQGVHYYFMQEHEFMTLAEQGGMLEWAKYAGNCYGTPRDMVEREQAAGHDVILEIDVQGAMQIKKACPEALLVFILPPSFAELTKRLVDRKTEDEATINRRLEAAHRELEQVGQYDYAVVNDQVEHAVAKLRAILSAAKCSISYMEQYVKEVL